MLNVPFLLPPGSPSAFQEELHLTQPWPQPQRALPGTSPLHSWCHSFKKKKLEYVHKVPNGKLRLFIQYHDPARTAFGDRAEQATYDEARSNSWADCILMWTIKVFRAGGKASENVNAEVRQEQEALHPSATCRPAWVIHGSHFTSKSHHKSVCKEKEAGARSASRQSTPEILQRASEMWKRPRKAEFKGCST